MTAGADGEEVRALLSAGTLTPAKFRAAIESVPHFGRDAWVDEIFGIQDVPTDGPELPRGCVPYLPCPVDAILGAIDAAAIGAEDVFVDVGAGVGRVAALVHLLTGASVIALEIQPVLAATARELAARLGLSNFQVVVGDVVELTPVITIGTVLFMYCPFTGPRLEGVLDGLKPTAKQRTLRLCTVNMPQIQRSWLSLQARGWGDLAVYRTS